MTNVTINPTEQAMHFTIMMTNDDGVYIEPRLYPTVDEAKARVQAGFHGCIKDDPDYEGPATLVWKEDTSFVDGRPFWMTTYPDCEDPADPGYIEYQIWAVTSDPEHAEMMAP